MRRKAALQPSRDEERRLHAFGYRLVAGIDEAGRGPLAGPVVAAAVILPAELESPHLSRVRDSKLLTAALRERLEPVIRQHAVSVGVGIAETAEIDAYNILRATHLAMARAVGRLGLAPQFLLIDAVPLPEILIPYKAIIRGDALCLSIAAASIIAKVTRDRLMRELDQRYPEYGFARHKGYPTREHVARLQQHGPCPVHRRTFGPVRRLLESNGRHPEARASRAEPP